MNEVTATPSVSNMRKRFTAYSAARTSALFSEGSFKLASLPQRLKNMKPLRNIWLAILPCSPSRSANLYRTGACNDVLWVGPLGPTPKSSDGGLQALRLQGLKPNATVSGCRG